MSEKQGRLFSPARAFKNLGLTYPKQPPTNKIVLIIRSFISCQVARFITLGGVNKGHLS